MGRVATSRAERPRVGYVLRSYPRLSQTHILNEILGLERLGHDIVLYGMEPSGETFTHEGVGRVMASAEFLDQALRRPLAATLADHLHVFRRRPLRYVSTAVFLMKRPDLTSGYTTTTRWPCFLQSVFLAAKLQRRRDGDKVDHLHSHFAHDPALIALLVSKLTSMSFSFTAHARDMFQIPPSALAERIKHARAVVTICQANVDYMRRVSPRERPTKFRVVHTGIDTDAFQPPEENDDGVIPPVIAAVSRLVEKKGLIDLLEALRRVKDGGRSFRCIIYGDGPLRSDLCRAIARLSLAGQVELAGPVTLAGVRSALHKADIFALTPFVTDDGDREGLPSSILEAMACGRPVVTTAVAGIPEAVIHEQTGLVAEPRDVASIAAQLERLLSDEALRRRLGANARAAIVEHWGANAVAEELSSVFAAASDRS